MVPDRRKGFDNTELVLTFSKHERHPRTNAAGESVPGGFYWRCIPDLAADVSVCLSDVHIVFDESSGTLSISRNRNAR